MIPLPRKGKGFFIGISPRGKATDFDSVIPLVRIQLSQPRRNGLYSIQKARLTPGFSHTVPSFLLFSKKAGFFGAPALWAIAVIAAPIFIS